MIVAVRQPQKLIEGLERAYALLQQNDVVYIKPRGVKLSNGGDVFLKFFSPTISALSSVLYIIALINR